MSISFIIYSYTQGEWQTASEAMTSETAVLIEPPEGAVTRVNTKPQCNSTPFGIKMAWIYKCVCVYMYVYIYTGYIWCIFSLSQTRSGGPGLLRMLRVAFCSRQRTPLLVSLYLLTVHVLLLLCMGGYLWERLIRLYWAKDSYIFIHLY